MLLGCSEEKKTSSTFKIIELTPIQKEELRSVHAVEWGSIIDRGFTDINSLSQNERIWFTIEPLIALGVIDHYVNSGAKWNKETIEDLELLNAVEIVQLMKRANGKFDRGLPADIDERNNQIANWEPDFIEELDSTFWSLNQDLENRLNSHIYRNFIRK